MLVNQTYEASDEIHHNCGIGGIFCNDGELTSLNLPGLMALILSTLQHRGQEGAGMYLVNTKKTFLTKSAGLAKTIFTEKVIQEMQAVKPHIAIGQDRYSTSGQMDAWQPFVQEEIGLVHNGNLTNAMSLLKKLPIELQNQAVSDSWIAHRMILHSPGKNIQEKIQQAVSQFEGAYNFIIVGEGKLFAVRDPWGFRPLVIGELPDKQGYVVVSETAALAPIQARLVREVKEGEGIVVDKTGFKTFFVDERTDPAKHAHCIFEFIYISAPDSQIFGKSVAQVRYECGRRLAKGDIEKGFLPDRIVPVQQSGILYAQGYSQEYIRHIVADPGKFGLSNDEVPEVVAGLVPVTGLVVNPYAGRIFIAPDRDAVRYTKHRANAPDISGKKVVLIDDSLIRGYAMPAAIKALREHPLSINMPEPKEIHVRIGCPPITHPCFMGVDFATHDELIMHQTNGNLERIRKTIGSDSLVYLSTKDLVSSVVGEERAAKIPKENMFSLSGHCGACFTGKYPVSIKGTYAK